MYFLHPGIGITHDLYAGSFGEHDATTIARLSLSLISALATAWFQGAWHSSSSRVARVYVGAAIVLLNVVIGFALLELVSASALLARGELLPANEDFDVRSRSSYYESQEWADLYWREFRDSRRQMYQPYVLWNRQAFPGQTIRVDASGVRFTPGARCGPASLDVFVMGGSTVWGTGSPDWGTLPAYIQTALQNTTSRPVCVVNYGESAYVSTQSVLRLMMELRAGHVPDLVIFYEGTNDVYSAYQSGKAGAHENLQQMAATFERSRVSPLSTLAGLMRQTHLFWVTEAVVSRATHAREAPAPLATYRTLGVDETALAASVVGTFRGNHDLVEALARKYGFEFRSFWPPHISTGRKPLTPEEQKLSDSVDPDFIRLYRSVYRAVISAPGASGNVVDLSSTFDDASELLWLDDMHVTPEGNQLLATRLVDLLHPVLHRAASHVPDETSHDR